MRLIIFLSVALAATSLVASGEQQRILRRVIKSTPTASNLGRVRAVTVRSSGPEKGAVSEISSKEAAAFGARSTNETATAAAPAATSQQQAQQATKTKSVQSTSTSPSTTSTTTTTTSTAAPASSSTTSTTQAPVAPKASERQQVAPQAAEVELLSSAPSSWQMMTAVEAPAAALIAAGTRASSASDLSSSSSEETSSSASFAPQSDFLRSSGKTSYSSAAGETFSRLRQQSSASKTRQQQQQQQSFFYPQQQQQQLRASKTSNYQATKTNWYQPSTTPRPAPIIQQQQEQQYEQQNEQYVEQQQVESAAPPGQAEPFAFDFNTQDTSGNGQYRKEESDNNGVVRGSYGFRDASGMYRHVEYVADANGFRANIKSNEPGLNAPEGVESQPASTRFTSGGQAPVQQSQRFTSASNQDNSGEWQAASSSSDERANLALAPPDFESSHKPERIQRAARYFRN